MTDELRATDRASKNMIEENTSDELLRSEIEFEKKSSDRTAKHLTEVLGSIGFLLGSLVFVLTWILINLGVVPDITPFDPYPFELLMMVVALLVAFIPIVVLINQNRQGRIAEVRQHVDLEVNVRAEHEITKILHMLDDLSTQLGTSRSDTELERMKAPTNLGDIKEKVENIIMR